MWLEADRAEKLQAILRNLRDHKFIDFEGRTINTADLSGVYDPIDMADLTRRKNGQWMCGFSNWHNRKDECLCWEDEYKKIENYRSQCALKCPDCSKTSSQFTRNFNLKCKCQKKANDLEEAARARRNKLSTK